MTHWLVVYKDMSKFEPPKYKLFRSPQPAMRFARALKGKQWQIKALEEEDPAPTPVSRKPRAPKDC
jgi:hypothetical protein